MSNLIKKALIVFTLAMTSFIIVKANQTTINDELLPPDAFYNYIEDEKLNSSRFTRQDDLSMIDEAHYIPITADDLLIHSNAQFNLYLNEETINFKVENKATNYVFSTAIDNAQAGSFTGLLSSGIGLEYINLRQNMNVRTNIGITDTEFTLEKENIPNGLRLNLSVGGYCSTRNCSRFYDDYLEGRYTLEQMIDFGLTEINVDFSLEVTLTDQGIKAHIPYESIVEDQTEWTVLSSLILFPGLGATFMEDIPGYMVIPDGIGTIIRYEDNQGQFNSPFEERFYDQNRGLRSGRLSVTSYPLSMPIFGAVHGVDQNAFIGIIEEGDMNARLLAFPNGANNLNYNLIFPKFDYRQTYRQSFTSDGSGGAQRIAETLHSDVTVHYNFLEGVGSTYVGIGLAYQDYLVERNVLSKQTSSNNDITMHTQFLMSDSTNRFLGKSLVQMSDVSQVIDMYDALVAQGINHQTVSLLGWNNGGYSGQLPTPVNFENRLGSDREFEAMIDYINQNNQVALVNNYIQATEASSNVSYRNDVAQGVDRFKLERSCSSCVYNSHYYLYPKSTERLANRHYEDYLEANVSVLFERLGSTLYSVYDSSIETREDAFNHYLNVMETYEGNAMYYYPNAYAYAYTNDFYHAPLYNSQLKYFDDLVPLLPIVLNGHMDLYSQFLNFNSLGSEQILMLVDFGINPSFILSYERSNQLRNTDIEHLYSTGFEMWEDSVVNTYHFINDALKHVNGETIQSRVVLDTGVIEVTYQNNVSIIVNYTSQSYTYQNTEIEPLNYIVLGGQS